MEPAVQERDLLEQVRAWTRVPALRLDLRFIRNKDTKTFRLCDPKTQRFIELYELECLVVQAINGERTIEDLLRLARGYNPNISREQIEQLGVQLLALDLLELEQDVNTTRPGHGKVIPFPNDEFAAFRNEIILDLQPSDTLSWMNADAHARAPFFAAPNNQADDLDNTNLTGADDFDNTNLAVADPFQVLDERAEESDTVMSSAQRPEPTPPPLPLHQQYQPPPPAAPAPSPPERPSTQASPTSVASEQDAILKASQQDKARWYKRRLVKVLAVLIVLVITSMLIPYPLRVTAECSITPVERAYVRAPIMGVISEILVDEGTRVKKGEVIARLDDRDLAADKRKSVAEVEKIEAELLRLNKGARPEEIQQQQAVLRARQAAVAFAQKEVTRKQRMLKEGVGSRQALEEAQGDYAVKGNAAAEASAALKLLQAGTRKEEVQAQEAALKRAKAELGLIEEKLSDMVVIRAPIDGVILTAKFRERLRESVPAGGLIAEISNTASVRAEIFVPEREVDTITNGMAVTVKVESFPLDAFDGRVDFIAPAVEDRNGLKVVRVVATLDNSRGLLRQNMTGYGEIECGERSVFTLATRRITRWFRVRFLL